MKKMWLVLVVVALVVLFLGLSFGMPQPAVVGDVSAAGVNGSPVTLNGVYDVGFFERGTINDVTINGTRCIVYSGNPLGESGLQCDFE